MVMMRFTAIDLIPDGVAFTVQDTDGKTARFKQVDFDGFCKTAIKLVGLGYAVADTDQLLGHWFEG